MIKTNILASRAKQYGLTLKSSILTPRLYKPIAITCGLMFFQRFSGANAFNYYAVIIFRQTLGGMNPHGATIAIGFVQLLASLLSGFLIDIVGRLPLLIASTVLMSLALAGFGSYAYYVSQTQNLGYSDSAVPTGEHDWIPLLCVLVFTTALALGISPISWLLIGELFPLEYRGIGSSISTSFSYFCAFCGIKLFMDFQQVSQFVIFYLFIFFLTEELKVSFRWTLRVENRKTNSFLPFLKFSYSFVVVRFSDYTEPFGFTRQWPSADFVSSSIACQKRRANSWTR